MAGYRFAADPQSGWLYAPPDAPVLDAARPGSPSARSSSSTRSSPGSGLFAFLRMESIGRVAATAGGLVLAMTVSTSTIAISLPFAGALAWTTVLLVAAAGSRRSQRWSGRLAWLALGGFAWSQVAAAHMSHGLVIATAFATVYLVAGAVADARVARDQRATRRAGRVALFLVVLPLAALPILVPHVDFLGEIQPAGRLRRARRCGAVGGRRSARFGRRLGGMAVGVRLGAGRLRGRGGAGMRPPGGSRSRLRRARDRGGRARARRLRADLLASWSGPAWFRSLMLEIPFGDVYLHNPGRLRYVAVLALPILAAAGLQGLVERPLSAPRRHAWLGAAGVRVLPLAARRRWQRRSVRDVRRGAAGSGAAAVRVRDATLAVGLALRRSSACSPMRTARERRLRADVRGRHRVHRTGDRRASERWCHRSCASHR